MHTTSRHDPPYWRGLEVTSSQEHRSPQLVCVCARACVSTRTGLIVFLPFLKGKFILKLLQAQSCYRVITVWYNRNQACPERVFLVLFGYFVRFFFFSFGCDLKF